MKRKLLATLLALCLIVGMIPVAASADNAGPWVVEFVSGSPMSYSTFDEAFCYENLPSEGRNNPSCPRTGCLHYRKHGFRRSQAGYQAPNPALSDVLDIHVFFCLD